MRVKRSGEIRKELTIQTLNARLDIVDSEISDLCDVLLIEDLSKDKSIIEKVLTQLYEIQDFINN